MYPQRPTGLRLAGCGRSEPSLLWSRVHANTLRAQAQRKSPHANRKHPHANLSPHLKQTRADRQNSEHQLQPQPSPHLKQPQSCPGQRQKRPEPQRNQVQAHPHSQRAANSRPLKYARTQTKHFHPQVNPCLKKAQAPHYQATQQEQAILQNQSQASRQSQKQASRQARTQAGRQARTQAGRQANPLPQQPQAKRE